MKDWFIFKGSGEPHDGIHQLPVPLISRDFDCSQSRRRSYYPTREEIEQVNLALYLRRPLVAIGQEGLDVASLAYDVAHELRLGDVLNWPLTSQSTIMDGLYVYDRAAREMDMAFEASAVDAPSPLENIGNYIRLGPLGTAFSPSDRPCVLLVEGLDKASDALIDDLSAMTERGSFEIPELVRLSPYVSSVRVQTCTDKSLDVYQGKVRCSAFPFILLISNNARQLRSSLISRCIGLKFTSPSTDKIMNMLELSLGIEVYAELADSIHRIIAESANKYLMYQYIVDAVWLTSYTDQPIQVLVEKLSNLEAMLNTAETVSDYHESDLNASQIFYGGLVQQVEINMSQDLNLSQTGSFGVGVNQGEINTEKLAGSIYEARNLSEAAVEIQSLLEQLSDTYPSGTTAENMTIATKAIAIIEDDSKKMNRVMSAIKAGGTQAIAQALNHPAASFVIAALEDWQKTK